MMMRRAGRVGRVRENRYIYIYIYIYIYNEFWGLNTKQTGHLKNLVGVNGRMMLKWVLKKWNGVTGFIGVRTGASGGHL